MNSPKFKIHSSAKIYGTSVIGKDTIILENVILGYPEHKVLMEILKQNLEIEDFDFPGCTIGQNSIIRIGSTIFSNVNTGKNLKTGHNVMIRENTEIGNSDVSVFSVILTVHIFAGREDFRPVRFCGPSPIGHPSPSEERANRERGRG